MGRLVEWHGEEIARRVELAAVRGSVEIVDDAAAEAAANTPVLTGAAKASVARENVGRVIYWGYHVPYGIWIEIGARGRAGVHALRRAGDAHYGRLTAAIARWYSRG
jgi:hypothetical protein